MDLSHIARREVFCAAWAHAHGLDSDAIARAVSAGHAHPLFRGWYAVRPPADDADWNRLAASGIPAIRRAGDGEQLTGEPLTALIAADAALHERKIDRADLDSALDLLARSRDIGPVRAGLRQADARVETPGETILRHRLRQLGWETEPQFEVPTEGGSRFADLRIEGTRVLVEFDGKVKYRGELGAFA